MTGGVTSLKGKGVPDNRECDLSVNVSIVSDGRNLALTKTKKWSP